MGLVLMEGMIMELISSNDYINVIENLHVMKYFMKRREYKRVETMCMDLIPGEIRKEIGNVKLIYKPSGIDFAKAVEIVWGFLLRNNKKNEIAVLNQQGFHSRTVVECMDILFKKRDFLCIEELCKMIDDDDLDEEARSVKNNLLRTRNNIITPKPAGGE